MVRYNEKKPQEFMPEEDESLWEMADLWSVSLWHWELWRPPSRAQGFHSLPGLRQVQEKRNDARS